MTLPLRSFTRRLCLAAGLTLCLSACFAEQAPTPTPAPTPPASVGKAPLGKVESKPQISDWSPYIADLQSPDKAKQDAAAQVFFDSGQVGHNVLGTLLGSKDADLVKRVRELRGKIEAQTYKIYQEAMQKRAKVLSGPLDADTLEDLKNTWLQVMAYATVVDVKRAAQQMIDNINQTIGNVENANTQLTEVGRQLKADPAPQGLLKASLLIAQSQGLRALFRHTDALKSAQEAKVAAGNKSRLTPMILKIEAEIYRRLMDFEGVYMVCRELIKDYPRSMESHFAYQQILEALLLQHRVDDAVQHVKAFNTAFPIDEDAQESISALLDSLMNQMHDYKHSAEITDWAIATLPPERVYAEFPKSLGGCSEYALKDYAKAEHAYSILKEYYPDAIDPKDVDKVLERVRRKAAGKFPKEPTESDLGPAGALAGFLRAVRTADGKALADFCMPDELDKFREELNAPGDSLVPLLTFCDVVVNNIEYSPTQETATMFLTVFPSAGKTSLTALEFAFKDEGKWKIRWRDFEDKQEQPENTSEQPAPNPITLPIPVPTPPEAAPQK